MNASNSKTPWLDPQLYPFQSNYYQLPDGKMHYVDEGKGEVILFVHGTPTWSFLYREYIRTLSKSHRCIAVDHLGFGLSDKSSEFEGTPQKHARNLMQLIEHLKLENITLVVHDFGGPIGLSCAIEKPEKIKRIVMFNTWLWETKSDPGAQKIDKILKGAMGRFLYLYLNFSPAVLVKQAFFDKKKLTSPIHKHYKKPFPNKKSRYGLLNIGLSLVGSSDWYAAQWEQISRIKDKPFLILWGMEDAFIKPEYLQKWESVLTNAQVSKFKAGHFVQEEDPQQSLQEIQSFLGS